VTEAAQPYIWLSGDESDNRGILANPTSTALRTIIGNKKIIVIDEAQRIADIGIAVKLLVDNYPDIQVIVTGSSAFELSGALNEPLTGRKYQYYLYPLSFGELAKSTSPTEEQRLLSHRLVYGYYPDIVTKAGEERELLTLLTESYLFKDIFTLEKIKKPTLFEKLLQALALQIGNEVSYQEIGTLIGADNQTIEKYIDLLEKNFVVFKLNSLSRNATNEIKKGKKIYFYDLGIRNALIKNFNPIELRQDLGGLWENFLLIERIKRNHYTKEYANSFFWRNLAGQKIDYIEERNGKLYAFEFKWAKKAKISRNFLECYPEAMPAIITRENMLDFVL
jgi:hypothetical protein